MGDYVKGLVFNLLEEVVSAEYGAETWDQLLDAAGTDGVYTSLGNYPDEELVRLVSAASAALDTPADDVVRWFGRRTMPLFAQRYPALFERHTSVRTFALTLNEVIHPEVRKLYPGAITPEFTFATTRADGLVMEYRSPRQLCAFAEGLLYGAADHFAQTITVKQPVCVRHGDDHCVLDLVIE
jgi:hypothetical protein